jgi:DASS family divalent anion:Na+ symporter
MSASFRKVTLIESSRALSALPRQQWARLINQFEPCTFQSGEVIQQAGEACQSFFQFEPGASALRFDPPGQPHGQHLECGEECLAGFKSNLFTVVATGEIQGWRLNSQSAMALGKAFPQIKDHALTTLAGRFRETLEPAEPKIRETKVKRDDLTSFQRIGWLTAILGPWLLYFGLNSQGIDSSIAVFLAILLDVVILWFFSLVDPFIPPFIGIAAAIFTGLVPADTALSGFASSSFLELLCVLVVSSVLMSSGLSFRLLLGFLKVIPKRFDWQIQIPMWLGFIVSPVIPSNNSRMALLLPIMQEIVSLARLDKNPIAATSILTCCYSASVIFSSMLPTSKATTIALVALLPKEIHAEFSGLFWFEAALIVTLGTWLCHVFLTQLLYRTQSCQPVRTDLIHEGLTVLGPLTFEEWVAGLSVLALIIGTMTYEYHHIPMSSISGLILFSLLSLGMISKSGFRKDIDWSLIFFLMGSQCLIRIAQSLGVDQFILDSLQGITHWIQESPWRLVSAIIAVIMPIRFMLPGPPTALLVTTLFNPIAIDNHINPWISLFVCGFLSDIWFMPYQSGSWSQTQSFSISKIMIVSRFNLYNQAMNLGRIGLVYLSIPYWQWLGVL